MRSRSAAVAVSIGCDVGARSGAGAVSIGCDGWSRSVAAAGSRGTTYLQTGYFNHVLYVDQSESYKCELKWGPRIDVGAIAEWIQAFFS